jgi:DNA-binding LytR/AlgR family response regulator
VTISSDSFFVKANQKLEKIFFKDILYVEGIENYVAIQTISGKVITHSTLKLILENLPEQLFIQTHKSFIINVEKVLNIARKL